MRHALLLTFLLITACASNEKTEAEMAKNKAKIFYAEGTRNLYAKNYTKALKNLLEAHKIDKTDSSIQNNLGMAYFFKNRPKIGLQFIQQALKTDPKNTDARMNLGNIYMNLGEYSKARKSFEIVLNDLVYENQHQTYFNLGILAKKRNRTTEAIGYFKQALNLRENYCPAHIQLGNIYFGGNDFERSLESYKRAGKGVCYNSPVPIYHQALSLIELKDYNGAKVKLREVVERFALTKYERMAHKQLKKLDQRIKYLEENPRIIKDSQGNILTPDF